MCVYIYIHIYVYILYIIWKHSNACLVYDLIFCRLRQASNALSKGPETREESAQLEVESMGAPTSTGAVASMHTKHGGGHKRKAVFGLLLIVATTIIMISRYISISFSLLFIDQNNFHKKNYWSENFIMTWGGVRGGVSIALALSLPLNGSDILTMAYIVVLISILLQGATFEKIVCRYFYK